MVKRLIAIAFIFLATSVAWLILGGTITSRTNNSGDRLRGRVQSVWGVPQIQSAPMAAYSVPVTYTDTVEEDGKKKLVVRTGTNTVAIWPSSSDVQVSLALDHRKKGLLWYSTYAVAFRGEYEFRNPDSKPHTMDLTLAFPASQAIYDDLQFLVNGQPVAAVNGKENSSVPVELKPQESVKLAVRYKSQGLESWRYSFGKDVSAVQNFLRMDTNFKDIDFPDNTLAPGVKREKGDGWELEWTYKNLVSGYQIAMAMPEKLQPGPLASQISFFAPVSLFFFFFLMFIITTLRGIDLHPMNYFFLAGAFFAFHLLLAYMVDHVDIHAAFVTASAVSVFLVVSYLRLVVGAAFALREAALAQIIYLVLFSYAFFFKGFTGLAITIGAIVTLFVVMQMTGRIQWTERFKAYGTAFQRPSLPV